MSHFQPLLTSLDNFQAQFERLEGKESELLELRDKFVSTLAAIPDHSAEVLNKDSALYRQSLCVRQSIEQSIDDWASRWEQSSPMRALSEAFADRVIFLVFGKVNAGKSSFCNFITEQFPPQSVKRFYLKDGAITPFEGSFEEGITETTARIQGVKLGSRLVLVDSPGLHSVTGKNGELTRRFTDSADAVLWLTPSTSPGQVQELDDLRIELQNQKPLLPVLTRSDKNEEEFDENDELVQRLVNKAAADRALQEDDVASRAAGKLDESGNSHVPLKTPVSISVHTFRNSAGTEQDFAGAGLGRLTEQLVTLLDESRDYKAKKAVQQVMNFLDGTVQKQLTDTILPEVASLQTEIRRARENLEHRQRWITSQVVSEVCLAITGLVEQHKSTRDEEALTRDLNQQIEKVLNDTLQQELAEFSRRLGKICSQLTPDGIGQFEDMTVDVREMTGSRKKSASTGFGTLLGAGLGTALLPGIGTAVGATLGGLAGNALGNNFIEASYRQEVVGVSSTQVIAKTTESVKKQLPRQINAVVQQVVSMIGAQESYAANVKRVIEQFQRDVQNHKEGL